MAGGRSGFAITISAADRVSGTINTINRKIASIRAPAERIQKSLNQFGRLTGLDRVAGGLRSVARSGMDAFRAVGRIIDPLAVITGAASIAGIVHLTMAWSRFGSQLGFTAQRIGVSASTLMGLQGAAELAGTSAGSLTSGLQGLGQTLYDAAGGRNPEAVALFNQLGISWKAGALSARSVTAVLPQLADKIAAMRSPYAQAQAAAIAFGGAADDLLPFLRLGSRGIRDYVAMAQRYGVMNEKGVRAANDLRIAQAKVSLAVTGLTNSIAEKLAPVLTPLLTQMAEWIARNREWIATKIGDAVKRVSDFIKGINWDTVGSAIQGIWNKITGAVTALGGWGPAVKDMLLAVGATWVAGMLAPFATIAAAIAGIVASLIALPGKAARAAAASRAALGAGGTGGRGYGLNPLFTAGPIGIAIETLTNGLPDIPDTPELHRQFPGMGPYQGPDPGPNFWHQDVNTSIGNLFRRWEGRAPVLDGPIEAEVRKDAIAAGMDPDKVVAQFRAEAGGYRNVSKAGAFGPAQLMPDTARSLGVAGSVDDPNYDWRANVRAGVTYDKQLLDRYHGNYPLMQAGYNWGPGHVDKWISGGADPAQLPAETKRYVSSIAGMSGNSESPLAPPDPAPAVELPSSVTDALAGLRTQQREGKIDVNVRVKADGKASATASAQASGSGVGKLKVEHPMPSAG